MNDVSCRWRTFLQSLNGSSIDHYSLMNQRHQGIWLGHGNQSIWGRWKCSSKGQWSELSSHVSVLRCHIYQSILGSMDKSPARPVEMGLAGVLEAGMTRILAARLSTLKCSRYLALKNYSMKRSMCHI